MGLRLVSVLLVGVSWRVRGRPNKGNTKNFPAVMDGLLGVSMNYGVSAFDISSTNTHQWLVPGRQGGHPLEVLEQLRHLRGALLLQQRAVVQRDLLTHADQQWGNARAVGAGAQEAEYQHRLHPAARLLDPGTHLGGSLRQQGGLPAAVLSAEYQWHVDGRLEVGAGERLLLVTAEEELAVVDCQP
jgi:hypothetical protein